MAVKRKKKKYGKNSKQRKVLMVALHVTVLFFALIGVITTVVFIIKGVGLLFKKTVKEPGVTEDYISVNSYSRPGIALNQVNGIVVHYTANPGSSAKQNRDYFQNLQFTHTTKASSHYVIGLEGEILQIIPLEEISYASNSRNTDTIAIECCHPDTTGKFTDQTYESLVNLVAWLCKKYGLNSDSVMRHYDITGKSCPKYFVDNEDAWQKFLKDVQDRL